jgi:hypothetical protein
VPEGAGHVAQMRSGGGLYARVVNWDEGRGSQFAIRLERVYWVARLRAGLS